MNLSLMLKIMGLFIKSLTQSMSNDDNENLP